MSVAVDYRKPAPQSRKSKQSALHIAQGVGLAKDKHMDAGAPTGKSSSVTAYSNSGLEQMKMNLGAIQRLDSRVSALLSTVPQVILYQYEESSGTWVSLGMTIL